MDPIDFLHKCLDGLTLSAGGDDFDEWVDNIRAARLFLKAVAINQQENANGSNPDLVRPQSTL